MLHFNRKTEYALLSIEHMVRKEGLSVSHPQVTSAREVSEAYHIPYPLLTKVLQKLAGKGMIKALHGTKGGYVLAKKPTDISVADVVTIFDGPVAVVECFKEEKITCPQWEDCHIRNPFYELNMKIQDLLTQTTVADLVVGHMASSKVQNETRVIS